MPLEFRPLLPAELEPLAAFLASVFDADPAAPFLDRRLLHWKFFEPAPSWPAERSYVLKNGSEFLAHGCLYPVTFLRPDGEPVTGMRLIDWAGSAKLPGAGVMLWKKLAGRTDTMMGVGGPAHTRAILPKMGFHQCGVQNVYARVIRPLRQFREYASWHWRAPLRLARNAVWSFPRPAGPEGWSTHPVTAFDDAMVPLFPKPGATFVPASRSAGLLNYLLKCPGARCSAFLLVERGRPVGYFVLNQVGPQARIVDLWIDGGLGEWKSAYQVAAATAALNPATCEVATVASTPFLCGALESQGFRLRARMPIFLYDPAEKLRSGPPLHLSLADGDEFHLYDAAIPTLT